MTDPLAHLYGDFAGDEDLEEPPVVAVSLDGLNSEVDPEHVEQISDHDLDELALLVRSKILGTGLTDHESVELGLGEIVTVEGTLDQDELALNDVGRAVFQRIADWRAAAVAAGAKRSDT